MKVRELLVAYQGSRAFRYLRVSTKHNYLFLIKLVTPVFAGRDCNKVTELDADNYYTQMVRHSTPYNAYKLMKFLGMVWNYGIRQGFVKGNPWAGMRLKAPKPRSTVWTREQFLTAVRACDELNMHQLQLLLEMCYMLGQRPRDCLNAKCENLKGDFLTFEQSKTGKVIHVYVPHVLRERLERIRSTPLANFVSVDRYPEKFFTTFAYNKQFQIMRTYAHLPNTLKVMDLRRTAVTEYSDAHATDAEIRAVSGHSHNSPVMVTVYQQKTAIQSRNAQLKRFPEEQAYFDDAETGQLSLDL